MYSFPAVDQMFKEQKWICPINIEHQDNAFYSISRNQITKMCIRDRYDKDQKEIEELMLRFMPSYMEDLYKGMYVTPQHAEQSLRNIFTCLLYTSFVITENC